MTENRRGKVVTFYSYKGGTGRTMALANVAWILAANGKRVLVADWDLESPGLHRFFHPFLNPEALQQAGGIVEMVRAYEQATTVDVLRDEQWHTDFARVEPYAFSVDWAHFPNGGGLDFLSAGEQNDDYAQSVYQRDWDDFFDRLGGDLLFKALRADMKARYDYALIDSRTGRSDVASICTVHLPDVLVDCFTFSEQGIDGAARIAAGVRRDASDRQIRILPVPMRVDLAEKERADAGRLVAKQRFEGMPDGMSERERDAYWATVEVPYQAFYAYEETLATFGDRPGAPASMLAAYEKLASYITGGEVRSLPRIDDRLRLQTAARFVRHAVQPEERVVLRYAPIDRLWAEWVARVLETAGVTVHAVMGGGAGENGRTFEGRSMTVVSAANHAAESALVPRDRDGARTPLVVYVADVRPLPGQGADDSAFLAGQAEPVAVERLLTLVGRAGAEVDPARVGLRFPGRSTHLFNVPVRNALFTGREGDLLELREHLLGSGTAVVLSGSMPVALQGMGGIGKTQLAMEYAHRFRNAYDAVWWINADPVTFIDTQLSDLNREMGLSTVGTIADQARSVLTALRRGELLPRWLMIFDNAEDVGPIAALLPSGSGGHVLITSRNPQWLERSRAMMQVEVFERGESVAHLRRRVPSIRTEQALRLAELLGDLPIAVAAAGAWLADTGTPIGDYLEQLEQHGPSEDPENPVLERTWSLSLERLHERSAAAYRLLQLCSVMAPEISLELVYSDKMAEMLADLDGSVSERPYRSKLVQTINRLALLKLDVGSGIMQVHRVLQHVVRERMTDAERAAARHDVHLVLAAARPVADVDDPTTWPSYRMLWPHLEVSMAYNSPDENVRRLMIDRVRYVWLTGGLAEGRRIGERVVQLWAQLAPRLPTDRDRAALIRQSLHLQFNLGNIIRDQSRFTESRALDERVLEQQRELLGDSHPHTLMTAGGLGADLRALGLYAEALERDRRTYPAWAEDFGDDNPRTLGALNNLASSQRLAGDFRAARDSDQRAYEQGQLVQNDMHPAVLNSGSNLGRDLREAGDYQQSTALLRDIANRMGKVLGETSRQWLNVQTNLAVSLRSGGEADKAAPLLEAAYESLNRMLGPANMDTLACRLSRAVNLLSVGDVSTAATELDQVERQYGTLLGESHPHTVACLNNRAATARAAGQPVAARDLAALAALRFDERLGPDHPYTLAALMNLAILDAQLGDVREAHRRLAPVAARMAEQLGPEHPDTVRCEANLMLMRGELEGRFASDEEAMARRLAAALGENHAALAAMRDGRFLHRTLDPHPF